MRWGKSKWLEAKLTEHALRASRWGANVTVADVPIPQPFARKYKNQPTDGHASAREANRAADLRLLERSGQISDLREQVPYVVIPRQLAAGSVAERACVYIADFVYRENGVEIVEDAKGIRTADYIIKRKLMRFVHGIVVREI